MLLPREDLQWAVQAAQPYNQHIVDFSKVSLGNIYPFTCQNWFFISNYWTINTDRWHFQSRPSSFTSHFIEREFFLHGSLFRNGGDEQNFIVDLATLPNASWNLLKHIPTTTSNQQITCVINNTATTAVATSTTTPTTTSSTTTATESVIVRERER